MKSITLAIYPLITTCGVISSNDSSLQAPHKLLNSQSSTPSFKENIPPVSLLSNHPQAAERYLTTLASQKKFERVGKPLPELTRDASQGILCFALRDTQDITKIKKYTEKLAKSTDPFPLLDQLPLCAEEPHECNIAQCIKILFSRTYFSNTKRQRALYSSLVLRALKEEAHCSLRQLHIFRHLSSLDLIHHIAKQINQHYKLELFINALPFSRSMLANHLYSEILKTSPCSISKDSCGIVAEFAGNDYFFSLLTNERREEIKQLLISKKYTKLRQDIGLLTADDIKRSKLP